MNKRIKILLVIALFFVVMAACVCVGSVSISVSDTLAIIRHKLFGSDLPEALDASLIPILWEIRMPRAFAAFLVGGALSVSGAVIQALLQNPLASSYTLGVSSGASLGAAIVIVTEITVPFLGMWMLPASGFFFAVMTILFVIFFSSKLDHNLQNHTIILFGMVFSLFINAILTLLSALYKSHMQRLILWQMGSFSGRRWSHVGILLVCILIGLLCLLPFHRELDMFTFGEEQSMAMGVDTKKTKIILLILSSLLTGVSVCFTGVIGFIDLTVPHLVRRIFGSAHRYTLPLSMLVGGTLMALADLISRTLIAPQEIPVGAVTALLGAPFFLWVYFHPGRSK
jgi:iron complex transport system permease protein